MRRDLACSLTLLAVSVAYYALASRIGDTALSDAIGPAGLPLIYAAVLAVLAVLLGLSALLRQRLVPASTTSAEIRPLFQLRRAGGALAIGVAYLVVAPVIGYPFAIALAIAAMAVYQGERPTLRLAVIACAGAAVFFVLFDLVLGISMPAPWNP
jgi:hypothetical protein